MRVAFWHDLPSGGGLRAMAGQIRALASLGHEVAVWTPGASDPRTSDWLPDQVSIRRNPLETERAPGYLDRRYGPSIAAVQSRITILDAHAARVCADAASWKADVLLVHSCVSFAASPLGRRWDGPSVLYLHEPRRALYEALPANVWAAPPSIAGRSARTRVEDHIVDQRRLAANRLKVRTEIEWASAFGRILVNSLFTRESVLRSYGLEATYCPLGVDHARFASAPEVAKEPTVVCVGELAWHKGARFAVDSIARIPAALRPPLRWFGNRVDEAYARSVRDDATRSGVTFVFSLMAADVVLADALARAACFIYCPRLEPLGLAPLEANLAGTAVVAVAEGGVRETIVDGVNGSLVPGRDPAAVGRAVLRFTSDLDLAATAGRAARQHVLAHHSWASAGKALEAQLASVIANHAM